MLFSYLYNELEELTPSRYLILYMKIIDNTVFNYRLRSPGWSLVLNKSQSLKY